MKSPRTLLLADLFLQGLLSLFKSMAVASVGIIALMFFFNYGKPYDWFHSPVIAACSVIAPLLLGAFLWRMILRGFGMMVLFIAFGLYVIEDLEPKLMLSNTFFLINSRSVLAPIIAISFFNNMQYRLQLEYVQSLSASVTSSDLLAAERYARSLQNAISQGHGFEQAQQVAVSSLDSTLQMQGLLLSVKDILGMMMVAALVVAVVSAFIPFHKAVRVKVVKTGEDMV
ncbi:MAG TPA: hypothetical protein IAC09_01280 [Candidatus Cryptobacteroides intestinipullorum]|nr:hypothetical protein [Candidatus Cryptobacteroides intestinipullorum]